MHMSVYRVELALVYQRKKWGHGKNGVRFRSRKDAFTSLNVDNDQACAD